MNSKINNIQSPPAVAIADTVRKLEKEGEQIAKLQTGEPCFYTPTYIKNALVKALENNYTQYCASQGIPELRTALSDWYKAEFGTEISANNILITEGAVGGIYCVVTALINDGEEVILVDPAWPQYENIIQLNGGKSVRIPTRKNRGKLTKVDLEKAITPSTRLIIINNPSNPAGIVYTEDEVNSFIATAQKYGIYLLFDEVYNRIVYSKNFRSVLSCSGYANYKEKIIYINSFSKTFAMTGWRIGYAFMDKNLLSSALLVSQNILTNISTFSQYAAVEAVRKMKEHTNEFTRMKDLYVKRNKELISLLERKGLDHLKPEGAFYMFIRVGADSVLFATELLEKEKIAVVPGISYGAEYNDFIRISFAVDERSYYRFLEWLNNWN